MTMEITNNYGSYGTQGMAESGRADSTKQKAASQTTGNSKPNSTAEYINELSKLAPSVEFRVGNTFATDKSGKTLTINPKLLEEMQNDPEKEKEMKELIRGVESAVNMLESVNQASGWTVVFKHCYIDENGKFRSIAYLRNDFMLNMSDKLREERRKNAEKLIEKTKEKAVAKKEELEEKKEVKDEQEVKEDKSEEKAGETSDLNKGETLLKEKMEAARDGMIYLYDTDLRTIMEAVKEEERTGTDTKEQAQIGANLDLKI